MLAFESALVLALMALSSAAVWLLLWRAACPTCCCCWRAGWGCASTGPCWRFRPARAGGGSTICRGRCAPCVLGIVVALVIAAGKLCMLARMFAQWEGAAGQGDST